MRSHKILGALLLMLTLAFGAFAQNRTTGGVKGKVRVESGETPDGVAVIARQGEREVARATTNRNGEFEVKGLQPGFYTLVFRKPGLRVGTLEKVEVQAKKTRSVSGNLFLPIDEGSIAFLRGSVFDARGLSLPNATVELALVQPDGALKRLASRVTNQTGSFSFRLSPDTAKYRVTVKADRMETVTKEVEIEGAAIYRVAVSLEPAAN